MASVVVSGASRGIGESIARALARDGHRLVLAARSEDRLARLADELGANWVRVDVTDSNSVDGAVASATELLGGAPDVMVNCAGTFEIAPLTQASVESLDRNLAANLRGPFLFMRRVLGPMLERGSGLIVNIGSVAGRRAYPGNAAYSASKFGLRGLHEVLLEEIRGTGVRATLVEPAAVDTPLWDPLRPDDAPDLPSRSQMLAPENVAEAVRFVVSQPPGVQIPLIQIARA